MLYDSVISLWVAYTHAQTLTHGLGLRGGQHTETAVPTHTDQNNVFVRKENSFMGHTHTQALEASLHALVPDSPIISLHLTVFP